MILLLRTTFIANTRNLSAHPSSIAADSNTENTPQDACFPPDLCCLMGFKLVCRPVSSAGDVLRALTPSAALYTPHIDGCSEPCCWEHARVLPCYLQTALIGMSITSVPVLQQPPKCITSSPISHRHLNSLSILPVQCWVKFRVFVTLRITALPLKTLVFYGLYNLLVAQPCSSF